MLNQSKILRSILLTTALATGTLAYADKITLKEVNATINISNQLPNLRVNITGADTSLSCQTKYHMGFGEYGGEDNTVTPQTKITLRGELPPGSTSQIDISFLDEVSVVTPSRLFYKRKSCELSLGISIEIIDVRTNKLIGTIPLIYGHGINPNAGFPLKTTDRRNKNLVLDKDFTSSFQLQSVYGGYHYSREAGGRVPFCAIKLATIEGVVAGFTGLNLPAEYCEIPAL